MKITTPLCEILGIRIPLIQAPMASATTPELAAAVCEAGALGSLGLAYTQPEAMMRDAERVRAMTKRPFNLNLFLTKGPESPDAAAQAPALAALAPYFEEMGLTRPQPVKAPFSPDQRAQLDAIEAIRPAVFTVHFGEIDPRRLAALKAQGIRIGCSATCVAEAKHLEALGVDFIIAQGAEAGGHRGTFMRDPYSAMTGTLALTRLIVKAVKTPVVAAGGIMDGAGIAAALALGAQAAQLGTAFLACAESGASAPHKAAILAANEDETDITEKFSGKPARGLVNRYMREMRDKPQLPFPVQNAAVAPLRTASAKAGNPDFVAMWAGQAAALAREMPAAALVSTLHAETIETLERVAKLQS